MSEIAVCPECDSSHIYYRSGSQGGPTGYRCQDCHAMVNRPMYRERYKHGTIAQGTLARKLLDMNPDEVTG